jgi:hypothetical protein
MVLSCIKRSKGYFFVWQSRLVINFCNSISEQNCWRILEKKNWSFDGIWLKYLSAIIQKILRARWLKVLGTEYSLKIKSLIIVEHVVSDQCIILEHEVSIATSFGKIFSLSEANFSKIMYSFQMPHAVE